MGRFLSENELIVRESGKIFVTKLEKFDAQRCSLVENQ